MASQNTVFKASDAEICTPVTKLITNDRITMHCCSPILRSSQPLSD